MFASIRRYRLQGGTTLELARRVDEGFAEEIAAQPGFVSYEFVDCGDGEVMTLSIFQTAEAAEASREHARRWSDERLEDFKFTRVEPLRGEILVSRAGGEMLAPGHTGGARKFVSIRRYALRRGEVADLMHIVDDSFADRIEALPGFNAYHALDCGHGEIAAISLLRDQGAAEESDELALEFVRDRLEAFDLERTEVIGGEVVVSRARAELLTPAHA
jgi:Antibiotic biosynthesis monooxygenase